MAKTEQVINETAVVNNNKNPRNLSVYLAQTIVDEKRCPACLGELGGAGWTCNDCGFNAAHFAGCWPIDTVEPV